MLEDRQLSSCTREVVQERRNTLSPAALTGIVELHLGSGQPKEFLIELKEMLLNSFPPKILPDT